MNVKANLYSFCPKLQQFKNSYLDNRPAVEANQRKQGWLGHAKHLLCLLHHTVAIAYACDLDYDMTRVQTHMGLLARNLYQH